MSDRMLRVARRNSAYCMFHFKLSQPYPKLCLARTRIKQNMLCDLAAEGDLPDVRFGPSGIVELQLECCGQTHLIFI